MKKIFSFAVVAMAAIALASCGNKTAGGDKADSTSTDSTAATAEVQEDPNLIENEVFSFTLPEGWGKNGEPSKYQANLKTTDHVPGFYMNVEVEDYIESIDEWKGHLNKDLKADGTIQAGDMTFTILSSKDAFYKVYGATMLPDDKGALVFDFTGDGNSDIQEQKDMIKGVLEAVKLK